MGDYFTRAVELGKEATAFGVRAGASLVEKTKEINTSMGGGAKVFDEADERDQEIKKLLDSSSDRQKLEGMKKLIALISKGRDASAFFPDVVKNVVAKHHEVRKLVYIFLVRYAEQEPDVALLSINTFQKDLTDSNQVIRALALRVLSNIRIEMIIQIVMMAIKKCIGDLSPYVRKTAALAIPKIYSLDSSLEVKPQLVQIIETLLNERSTLVIGSVIAAFNEVCPDRYELIHKHYRKICHMLIDMDEWGVIAALNLLLRYARTQFENPNLNEESEPVDRPFYSNDEEEEEKPSEPESNGNKAKTYTMDPDLRLLLSSCLPLMNNRNTAVVLAVASLYFHLAPRTEFPKVGKPLVGLLGSHPEIQYVLLANISTMAAVRPGSFEPYLKKFYVNSTDPYYVKVLKLEIITRIASESNISQILKEFQAYVRSPERKFVTETIQAIGRCATLLPSVAESCLVGLMSLISSKNEAVVGESVVVIKALLQLRADDNVEMIRTLAKTLDKISVPMAKASILWLVGEYCEKVPNVAPDVLRRFAQSFANEADIVKLEIINLGAKLFLQKSKRSEALFDHILNLAKYDLNYDIRDRARLLRALCFSKGKLGENARKIVFSVKPAPHFETVSAGRERFTSSSLSHVLNKPAPGYKALPDFPEVAPDTSVRETLEEKWQNKGESLFVKGEKKKSKKDKKFDNLENFLASDDEDSGSDRTRSDDDYSDYSRSRSRSRSGSRSRSYSRSRSPSYSRSRSRSYSRSRSRSRSYSRSRSRSYSRSRSRSRSPSYSRSRSRSYSRSRSPSPPPVQQQRVQQPPKAATPAPIKSNDSKRPSSKAAEPPKEQQLLLDFDDFGTSTADAPYSSLSGDLMATLTPTIAPAASPSKQLDETDEVVDVKIPTIKFKIYPLLSHVTSRGLSVEYFFGRRTSLYPERMVSVQLVLTNRGQKPISNIRLGTDNLDKSTEVIPFNPIGELSVEDATEVNLNVDFNQKANPINFQIITDDGKFSVKLEPPFGELFSPKAISPSQFKSLKAKLGGMFESSAFLNEGELKWETNNIVRRVLRSANVSPLDNYGPASTVDEFQFHGLLLGSNKPILISLKAPENGRLKVTVNSEDMVVSSTVLKSLKSNLTEN